MFGEPLNNKSEEAWNDLMPNMSSYFLETCLMLMNNFMISWCRFVVIKNDPALPDQPGLDPSIPEQKAMVAVFHQVHCIVSFVSR